MGLLVQGSGGRGEDVNEGETLRRVDAGRANQ